MALVKHGKIQEDAWTRIENDSLPLGRPLLLTREEWCCLAATLRHWEQPLGLLLEGSDSLDDLRPVLDRFRLIALNFPKFTDGRAYSQARLLRKRYGYSGELRAVGNILQDQFLQMHRCGFDSYEVADGKVAEVWAAAIHRYRGFYQSAERGQRREGACTLPVEQPAAAAWAY